MYNTMNSVILISKRANILVELQTYWNNISTATFIPEDNRLSIEMDLGRIYIDDLGNIIEEYDEDETKQFSSEYRYFFSICYSNKVVMEEFLTNSHWDEDTLFDNDNGNIIPYNLLKNKEIKDFIV